MTFKTEQEEFWAGDFGDEYVKRNSGKNIIASNVGLFSDVVKHTGKISSLIEFGANRGLNIEALKTLVPDCEFSGVEINKEAFNILSSIQGIISYNESILDFNIDYKRDLVLIKGVLIHINPSYLEEVYKKLYEASKKYILICEYYNPKPVEVNYRGHENRLFKRDFAGEILAKYPDLELIDYKFLYHLDKAYPSDDATWFLLKKK